MPKCLGQRYAGIVTRKLSIFICNRLAFMSLMGIALFVKILVSATVPASADLQYVVSAITTSIKAYWGPWVFFEEQFFHVWQFMTNAPSTMLAVWLTTPPAAMTAELRLLSFLLRLPYLMFDVATAVSIYYLVAGATDQNMARLSALLWFLNPFVLFAVEMLCVPDVAVTFLTVCAVLFLLKKHVLSGAFLAAGIALKLYPILLFPVFLFYGEFVLRVQRRFMILLTASMLAGLLSYLGWVLSAGEWGLVALTLYTPISQPINTLFQPFSQITVPVSVVTVGLVILYFFIWRCAKGARQITSVILPVFLVYYAFSNPYPQYYVWALPFLIFDVAVVNRRHLPLLAIVLVLAFLHWFIVSSAFLTPSGYSLLLFQIKGENTPWFSQVLSSFLQSDMNKLLLSPLINATLFSATLVYALEIARGWFKLAA